MRLSRLLFIAWLISACAHSPVVEPERADPNPELSHFFFLEGEWISCESGSVTEETWIADEARWRGEGVVTTGASRRTEAMTIERRDGGWYFTAQPEGQEPTSFRLVAVAPYAAIFENRDHDFPQVVVYRREGVRLFAQVATVDGTREHSWSFVTKDGEDCTLPE